MIAIIDYGMGNLRSVKKAFEALGFNAVITDELKTIDDAHSIVLPGVGAISEALINLKQKRLDESLLQSIKLGKPFLGICLGMQLLFEKSYEGGLFESLAIIKGAIKRFPSDKGLKVPHTGWNKVVSNEDAIFSGLPHSFYTYFVHSYCLEGTLPETIATSFYGIEITSAVKKENVYGVQFHPEKSGVVGLKILENFGRMK